MATVAFAKSTPSASTLTALRTVTAGKNLVGDLNVCNRATSAVTIRVSVNDGAENYLEYDLSLRSSADGYGNSYRLSNIKLPASAILKVWSTGTATDFTLSYAEETAS